jgi:hypothetical protein
LQTTPYRNCTVVEEVVLRPEQSLAQRGGESDIDVRRVAGRRAKKMLPVAQRRGRTGHDDAQLRERVEKRNRQTSDSIATGSGKLGKGDTDFRNRRKSKPCGWKERRQSIEQLTRAVKQKGRRLAPGECTGGARFECNPA